MDTRKAVPQHLLIGDAEIADATIPFEFMNSIWQVVNFYDGPVIYEKTAARVSRSQRLMLAVVWYCAEVNNGGHEQFYQNSTGLLWRDALKGFEEFDLPEFAQLIAASALRIGGNPALDRAERQKCLLDIAPNFEDLDDLFAEREEKSNLDAKLLKYIRDHPSQFYLDMKIEKEL